MWGGIVLPKGAVIAGLPAFDGFGRGLVAGVGGELVFPRPAADAGAVGLNLLSAVAGWTTTGLRGQVVAGKPRA